jgi:hypothetical protein
MPSLSSLLSSNPNSFTSFLQGITSKVLPAKLIDGNQQSPRMNQYGEFIHTPLSENNQCADEGSYFMIGNPTLGTGLATGATNTAASDLTNYIVLMNMDQYGGKNVILDYLRLTCTGAGTAAAALHFQSAIDNSVGRYTSGDGLASAPKNCNMNSSVGSVVKAVAGPIVTAAATAQKRDLGRGCIRVVIPVVGDTYLWTFGKSNAGGGGLITSGTTQCSQVFSHVPVVFGPQQMFSFNLWGASMSAGPLFSFEMGWTER